MKKSMILFSILFTLVLTAIYPTIALVDNCELSASLVNQDPVTAIPGEELRLVFQIEGVDNPSCGKVDFTLLEAFPIVIEEGTDHTTSINAGVFVRSFGKFFLAPYTVILNENSLDGESKIEAILKSEITEKIVEFQIRIEDSRADFEISVNDYRPSTKEITFEILNIAESDVNSLTIEIEKQDNIVIKGSNRNIIGSLDANEDTTFSFEARPKDGDIILDVYYTDKTGFRRQIKKTVMYDSTYFTNRARDDDGGNSTMYWVIGIVVVLIIWWFWSRARKKKHHAAHHEHHKAHHAAAHHKKR